MIALAIQRGSYVYVYDEKNHQLFSHFGELAGYTGSTVSVRRGNYVYVYDEKHHQIAARFAPQK